MRPFRGDEYLEQYSFDAGTSTWRMVGILRANGQEIPVSGTPSLIQSTYGQGSFELLVPNGRDVVHYTNDKRSRTWTWVASLYPVGQPSGLGGAEAIPAFSSGVSVFQSTFGSPGNLEAIVLKERALNRPNYLDAWFYTRQDRQWTRIGPVTIGNTSVTNVSGF